MKMECQRIAMVITSLGFYSTTEFKYCSNNQPLHKSLLEEEYIFFHPNVIEETMVNEVNKESKTYKSNVSKLQTEYFMYP